jgi:pyroglutamyl-peptidase
MPPILVLTGFEPFRGERINPSWEVARSFDGEVIGGLQIKSVRVPVGCAKATRRIRAAIVRYRPRAVIGLGEAGGRPAISLERIAINLADERGALATSGDPGFTPVVRDGPDAYFSRLPLRAIVRELDRNTIPASVSLTAGAYACNALMYAALHYLRRKPAVPVGFIHLPYTAGQAGRHRSLPSMALTQMETAVRIAIVETARSAK